MKKPLKYLQVSDDVVQILLAVLLLVSAIVILGFASYHFVENVVTDQFKAVIELIHELLLIMILLELMSTVLTYLKEHIIPLAPFIIIGIISSLRKLLTIGAEMTLSNFSENVSDKIFQRYLSELGIHTAIVLVLVIALWFVMRYRVLSTQTPTSQQRKNFKRTQNKPAQQRK
jgi:uncharacterized membrane protein (DUF373 family)